MDEADKDFRERSRIPSRGPQGGTRATTLQEIQHSSRSPVEVWLLCEITSPLIDPSEWPKNHISSCTFNDIPPSRPFVRALNGPVTVAFGACGLLAISASWAVRAN